MHRFDPIRLTPAPADPFLVVDFLAGILKITEDPSQMSQFLARQVRAFMGVRAVILLQPGSEGGDGTPRIVAQEPEGIADPLLLGGLAQVLRLQADLPQAALFDRASVSGELGAALDLLGVASLSMTPLRVGESAVGTLFALDHLDPQPESDITHVLRALAPVFALILRNTLHFESQEARVQKQAEKHQALLRTTLDGYVVLGGDGVLQDANEAYLRMSGYGLEELCQLHLADLEALESPAQFVSRSEQVKREGSARFLSRHRRKDGSSFPVEVSTTYVPGQDLFIGFIRDLTGQVAAETALRESEAHHRELVEILGEGVAATDPDELVVMANPEADRIFGLDRHQLVGKNLRTFIDEGDWLKVTGQTSRRLSGRTDTYQFRIRRPDGLQRTLHLTASPRRDGSGQIVGSLAVFRDVTEELQTQQALRLAQKMESLGNLAGGLAHDMNNVLGAILGLASIHLEQQPEGTRLHSTFATITKASLRGRNMVKTLLDFARRDMAGERCLSLNRLVEDEARLLERTLPAQVSLHLDLDAGAGTLLGDPDALSLMLMNLCANAVDAMPQGGTLTLGTRSLLDGRVLLAVSDTGTGMAPETLEHALDPFFTTKPHGKGTGLGLSLAYSTVKAHRGELDIQSRPGRGTTIEMRFPKAHGQDEPAGQAQAQGAPATPALHILLVDDDELIQSSVAAQLEVMGHRATLAPSGEEAMALVDQGLRPDLVILDLNMPGWGGARTLPMLQAALPGVPILLSTGRADQHAIDLAHTHPGVTILAKPFSFRELQGTFAAVLARSR